MKPIAATLLASALAIAFSSAYAVTDKDAKTESAAYSSMIKQAAADYKLADAKCTAMSGNERTFCHEEAKLARARVEADAVAEHRNTIKARISARTAVANAEHGLAVAKCASMSGSEKDSCLANAKSVQVAALAEIKADRNAQVTAAVDKCAQMSGGKPVAGCVIDEKAPTLVQRTERSEQSATQRTKEAAATMADKTERVAERAGDATSNMANKTGKVVADSVITTKVKADLFKEPELSSMAIHVETEKGVVMLSGFVDTKADADKAVQLAKSVEGVTDVKSAIKVK